MVRGIGSGIGEMGEGGKVGRRDWGGWGGHAGRGRGEVGDEEEEEERSRGGFWSQVSEFWLRRFGQDELWLLPHPPFTKAVSFRYSSLQRW